MAKQIKNAFRDPESNAVVIDDPEGYEAAQSRRLLAARTKEREDQVRELSARLNETDKKLERLLTLVSNLK